MEKIHNVRHFIVENLPRFFFITKMDVDIVHLMYNYIYHSSLLIKVTKNNTCWDIFNICKVIEVGTDNDSC